MNNGNRNFFAQFKVTKEELIQLLRPGDNPEGKTKALLVIISLLFSPVTLFGMLTFYRRGYSRFMESDGEYPRLYNLRPIIWVAMSIGALLVWVIIFLSFKFMLPLLMWIMGSVFPMSPKSTLILFLAHSVITMAIFIWFARWRFSIHTYLTESKRHGTARFATLKELLPYKKLAKGFCIGASTFYDKAGHFLTVAGTRSGKSVYLILQNLLSPFFNGSWVIIDPKAELASISARVQRLFGRKVVILNPWQILGLANSSYNPLDILKNDRLNLSDDCEMLAESIVPMQSGNEEDHWSQRARSFISGLLMHLVTSAPEPDRHLGTLWQWLRLDTESWISLLADMAVNDDPNVGEIVRATANEISSLMKNSDKEYGSVISSAQKYTDFIKSPALRDSLKSSPDFSSDDLASGKCTVYICIPFDRLKSHNAWTRLIVTSLMRSVIRNPKRKKTCFLIDEMYAFGFHSEIDMALGAYAGFGIHVWSIWQHLGQIKELWGDKWEGFIANCSLRSFFGISDLFSAEYLERLFGKTSVLEYDEKGQIKGASARPLITADEMRTQYGEFMYTVIDNLPPALIPKIGYYEMNLDCDPNPYYKPENENNDEEELEKGEAPTQ